MSPRLLRLLPFLPLAVVTALVARAAIAAVLTKLGHPGAALDDAYIHFQYARAIAEGHPFRYEAGEPISTGATSFAWPALLALPWLFGFRGELVMWPAWAFSFVALGALAYETYALARPLAGRAAAYGAAAMTLLFGGLVWGAASGMEVVPFAWLVIFATRRACTWLEDEPSRSRRGLLVLLGLAMLLPLTRPEGAVTSILIGAAVALGGRSWKERAPALAFAAAALTPNLLLVLLTGHATASTAQVKLLFGNPYYPLGSTVQQNAVVLITKILDGDTWSNEFLPKGGAGAACAGLAAVCWRGAVTKRYFRTVAVLVCALSIFIPCVYVTFLWNRLRYLWPFAPGWMIGLACLARAIGAVIGRIDARAGASATALLAGGAAGALAVRLDWVIEDVAQSASGIDRQQVALGRWANENLAKNVRIGVNDTGAIAYFGNRKTFDVVGLTTPSEGRYWVGGQGSRFEHYEKMPREALPTHFIVYPEWMGCEPLLGRLMHEAVVTDSTILGGTSMRVHEARWLGLGTGEKPWSTIMKTVTDSVDVADLESEAAHHYMLEGARDGEQAVEQTIDKNSQVVVDGGRTNRRRDLFLTSLPTSGRVEGLMRVSSSEGSVLVVRWNDAEIARIPVIGSQVQELGFTFPEGAGAAAAGAQKWLEVNAEGAAFTSFHYWVGTSAL